MELEKFLLQQIQYLASPASDLPKPIAAFGVTPKKFELLFKKSDSLFKKIKKVLDKNRRRELKKLEDEHLGLGYPMQEQRDEIANKYENLIKNYGDRPELLEEIIEWRSEALSPYTRYIANQRNYINRMSTPLRDRAERFELIDFNLREFHNARKRMVELRDEYGIEDEYSLEDAPFEIQNEYNFVSGYNHKLIIAPYVLIHNLDNLNSDPISLEYLLKEFNSSSGISFIKWGGVFFEPNHKFWAEQASDELKTLIYTKFTIYDDAVNITPIENRLKEELEERNINYKFQYPFKGYVLDFLIEANGRCLDVECDGKEFHSSVQAVEHDRIRNNVMAANNIYVLRFSGTEIWKDVRACVDLIENSLK